MILAQATGGLDPDPPDPGAVALGLAPGALLVLCAVLAYVLARRDGRHWPVARALVVLAGAMLSRLALHMLVLHGGPYTGWMRVAFHAEELLRLVTAAVPAWVAWATLAPEHRPEVRQFGRWLREAICFSVWGAWIGLVEAYPELRGERLRIVYLVAELTSLFIASLVIITWVRRRGWWCDACDPDYEGQGDRHAPEACPLPPAHTWAAVLALVAADLLLLLVGAWPRGLFGRAYEIQQAGLLALYLGLVAVHLVVLRPPRAPS